MHSPGDLPTDWQAPEPPVERPVWAATARPRWAVGTITLSALLHLGLALAAITLVPAWSPPEAERGGEPVLDVLMIGAEEAEAMLEGAKPEPVSLTLPPAPALEPLPPEPVAEPPSPEPLPPEAVIAPLPEPDPQPAASPVEHRAPPPILSPPRPVVRQAEKSRNRPAHRAKPEARGKQGEGRAMASRPAQSRGGTGGSAAVAGHAALTSFRSRLVAHLNRYKTYPEQAQERGLTGRNAVTLTLSREGRVLSAALSGPSGHALLDSATLAAVKRAQPFPAIPEGGPPSLTVTIGLNYQLQ